MIALHFTVEDFGDVDDSVRLDTLVDVPGEGKQIVNTLLMGPNDLVRLQQAIDAYYAVNVDFTLENPPEVKAWVVMLNDSPRGVVLGTKAFAEARMAEMRELYGRVEGRSLYWRIYDFELVEEGR